MTILCSNILLMVFNDNMILDSYRTISNGRLKYVAEDTFKYNTKLKELYVFPCKTLFSWRIRAYMYE